MRRFLNDFFDGFAAVFSSDACVLGKRTYPSGCAATEYLDLNLEKLYGVQTELSKLAEEFTVFATARDPSSMAYAQQALERAWGKLLELPVYRDVGSLNGTTGVFRYLREQPRELDDMMTEGTEQHEAMTRWLEKLRDFSRSITLFQNRANIFLDEYAADLGHRTPDAYATMYGQYRFDMEQAWDWADQELAIDEDVLSPEELSAMQDHMSAEIQYRNFPTEFQINVSYQTILLPVGKGKKKEYQIAERTTFEDLTSFLYVDFIKGLAAGHIPRRCQHCKRWFLLTSGYDIRYCERVAPGERKRTCRQVGAHAKERTENRKPIQKEYKRTYSRLKSRKNRNTITEDEWNRAVAVAQEIKARALAGELLEPDWTAQLKAL